MSAAPWPDHLLSLEEWDALPEDNTRHYELDEGNLYVTPRALSFHQRAMWRLCATIEGQLPDRFTVLPDTEVVLVESWPATVRAPDVIVVSAALAQTNPSRYLAADVELAVEIVSPGSKRMDRVTKLFEYADAGIPDYWIVDLDDPVSLIAYRLVNGEYQQVTEGSGVLELASPAAVTLDLDGLVRRRA